MSRLRTYTVRPFSKPHRSDLKDAFRVFLSPGTLLLNKLRAGDICYLEMETVSAPIQVWTAYDKIQDNVVQTSKLLQEIHGFRSGDKVSIRRDEAPLTEVQTVSLSEIQSESEKTISIVHQGHWEWLLEYPLQRAELICVGMLFDSIELKGQKRSFKVEQINSSRFPDKLYQFVSHSMVQLHMTRGSLDESRSSFEITRDGIGGLTHQIEVLNQWLAEYDDMDDWFEPVSYEPFCHGGILLHGPYGTGKTLILRNIAQAQWRKTFHVDLDVLAEYGGKPVTALSKIFGDALQHQPSVIIMDNFEFLAGGQDLPGSPLSNNIVLSLCKGLDRIDGSRVLLVAATNKLNDVNERLRQYFINNIEIPLPDSKARGQILKILCDLPRDAVEEKLDAVADRTPSYSGRDLFLLVQRAIKKAKIRIRASQFEDDKGPHGSTNSDSGSSKIPGRSLKMECKIEMIDYDNARAEVRPTTMQAITLEMPKVRWSDIGGQNKTKELLMQAVEWPLTRASELQAAGLNPKKSLLLYGPPGCSKTLMARAVATEYSLNFISVKGPELLNMYVGESERMIREVFNRARAAKPSVLFFDEIDAIGASRQEPGIHSGPHTLSTLLNEIDGIEDLQGVFILAATNKPESLDSALTRLGRFDEMIYVGPPDLEAREKILEIHLRKMTVAEDVDLNWLARETEGFSGAEIAGMCQQAGYAMVKAAVNNMSVERVHFQVALANIEPQITPEMRKRYEDFKRE